MTSTSLQSAEGALATLSRKCYEHGIPILQNAIDPQKLSAKHPAETAFLMEQRRARFERSGVFLDGFGLVSAAGLMDFRLSAWEKLVLAAMKVFSGKDHHARVKVSTIRKATNLGKRQVDDAIAALTNYGYLKSVSCRDEKNRRARSEYICIDNPKGLRGTYTCKGEYRGAHYEFPMRFDQWGRVSKAVFCDEQLNKYDKLLYVALCVMGKGNMAFDGKHGYLSILLGGYTKERLQHAFQRLEAFGYIHTTPINQGRHYTINVKPHCIPYPAMFFCNDMFKLLSYKELHQGIRISDLSSVLGKPVVIDDVVTAALIRQEQYVMGYRGFDAERAESVYQEISSSVPDYKRVLLSADPRLSHIDLHSSAPEGMVVDDAPVWPEPSKEVVALLEACREEDKKTPAHDYGREYERGFDLRKPQNKFQEKIASLHRANVCENLTEEDKIIYKICARGGIPEEFGWPENSDNLLKTIDLLLDAVPGIETAVEYKCLLQALQTLRNIAEFGSRYKVNGEQVDVIQFIHSINYAMTIDEGGVTISGLLQRAAKFGGKNLVQGNVNHFKSAIVHLLENLTRMRQHFSPIQKSDPSYRDLQRTLPMWHGGSSGWTFKARTIPCTA